VADVVGLPCFGLLHRRQNDNPLTHQVSNTRFHGIRVFQSTGSAVSRFSLVSVAKRRAAADGILNLYAYGNETPVLITITTKARIWSLS